MALNIRFGFTCHRQKCGDRFDVFAHYAWDCSRWSAPKGLLEVRYKPTEKEIAELIENRIKFGMSREWDYFRLVDIRDRRLNSIRERCLQLDQASTEERARWGLRKYCPVSARGNEHVT